MLGGLSLRPGRKDDAESLTRIAQLASLFALGALCWLAPIARAQDLFEIQVYPYETVEPRHTMVELHMNFIPSGTKDTEGGLFPNNHQFHFTVEVTHGLSKHWELGWYLVTAYVPDVGPKFAGARIRPRVRAPETWRLPFRFSLSTELGFNKHQFDLNTITLEIRPIFEKEFRKWYLSVNPNLSLSFRGADAGCAPSFEPGVKTYYNLTKLIAPGIEYYAETGPINHFFPGSQQHHILFATLDLNTSPKWELNFGVGRGLTGSSEHWIAKWIIGRRFKL